MTETTGKPAKTLTMSDIARLLNREATYIKQWLLDAQLVRYRTDGKTQLNAYELTDLGKEAGDFVVKGVKHYTYQHYEMIVFPESILLRIEPTHVPVKKPTRKDVAGRVELLEAQVKKLATELADANDRINHLFMRINEKKVG
jgi:hypothetical protein